MGWTKSDSAVSNGLERSLSETDGEYNERVEAYRKLESERAEITRLAKEEEEKKMAQWELDHPVPTVDQQRVTMALSLQQWVKEAKEGDFSHSPQPEPTQEEINYLLDWYRQRDALPKLMASLKEVGWDSLTDLWELRVALKYFRSVAF